MKKKAFVILIAVCVLVPLLIFGAYQIGFNSGRSSFRQEQSQLNTPKGPSATWIQGYDTGYQDGLKDAQTGITPIP